jgi:hypothetical protein
VNEPEARAKEIEAGARDNLRLLDGRLRMLL